MASIEKRGNGYRISVCCGYDSAGKKIIKRMSYMPEKGTTDKQISKELEKQAALFQAKCESGHIVDSNIKFADFAVKWFEIHAQKQCKPTTAENYKSQTSRILPAIGHMRLKKISAVHIQELLNNLEEPGMRLDIKYKPADDFTELILLDMTRQQLSELAGISVRTVYSCANGKNIAAKSAIAICKALRYDIEELFSQVDSSATLSSKTVRNYYGLLSEIFEKAVQWGYLENNPCKRVSPPKLQRKEARFLDETEASRLLALLEGEPLQYSVIIKLLIYTGFRRGELCGLEWDNIDFNKKIITINKTSLYLPQKGIYTDTPKSYMSNRVIKVSDFVIDLLRFFKKEQYKSRLKIGSAWQDSNRLFTQWNGKPIHPDTISHWFKDFIDKNALPDVSIHSLRHTNATLLIASGTPLPTISKRLGHSNVATTANIYTHAIRSADEAAAETLQNILDINSNNLK